MSDVLTIVLPVFGLLALGWFSAKVKLLGDRTTDGLSDFVFVVALPCFLVKSLVTGSLPPDLPWGYWGAYFGALLAVWGASMLVAAKLFKVSGREAVIAGLATGQANTVMIGIPILTKAYGDAAAAPIVLLLAVNLPVTMTLATLALEGVGAGRGFGAVKRLAIGLATNPAILAMAVGISWRLSGLGIHPTVGAIMDQLAGAAIPCALFAMGLSLSRYPLRGALPLASMVSVLKLMVHPALAYLLAVYVFDLSPLFVGAAVLFASAPVGVQVFLFASRYKTGVDFASTAVALSTGLAILTTSFWLWALGLG